MNELSLSNQLLISSQEHSDELYFMMQSIVECINSGYSSCVSIGDWSEDTLNQLRSLGFSFGKPIDGIVGKVYCIMWDFRRIRIPQTKYIETKELQQGFDNFEVL